MYREHQDETIKERIIDMHIRLGIQLQLVVTGYVYPAIHLIVHQLCHKWAHRESIMIVNL